MNSKPQGNKGPLWKAMAVLALFAVALSSTPIRGASVQDKQGQLDDVNKKINSTKQKIDQTKKQETQVLAEIERIERDLDQKRSELARVEKELSKATQKQQQLEKELQQAEKDLDEADAQLNKHLDRFNKRLRALYINGGLSYMDFLFSADDFADFITRAELIQRLLASDVELYQGVKEEKTRVEENRQKVLEKKAAVEEQRRQMLALRAQVTAKIQQIQAQAQQREKLLAQITARKESYEQALDELENTSRELQTWLKNQQSKPQEGATPKTSKGNFLWPVNGPITSEFGWRVHPIYKTKRFHEGLDIAVPMGTPVKAAAGGKVILADWAGGYGKAVIIDHGGGISTLYGHNSSLDVKVGDVVYPGQVISHAGSTGFSTGPHVHFEVRQNGAPVNPHDWLKKK